jgi:prolyl-tRNA editing enzyme YbaK/EbsC (Cys-tRNA(Pro) deacylase)
VHRNVERVESILRDLGATGRPVELAKSTRTSADAAQAIGTSVAQIAKSIVFTHGEGGVLVIASGSNRVSEQKLAGLIGDRIGRADATGVRRLTGYPIGGVAPVGHAARLTVFVDEELAAYDQVWAAAGTPNAVFPTTAAELVRISGGRLADVKEE